MINGSLAARWLSSGLIVKMAAFQGFFRKALENVSHGQWSGDAATDSMGQGRKIVVF